MEALKKQHAMISHAAKLRALAVSLLNRLWST